MKQNAFSWKQSLATVAVLTALNSAEPAVADATTTVAPTNRVKLAAEGTTIEADQISVNQSTGVVTARGSVRAESGSAFIARAQSLANEATRMVNEADLILARADELVPQLTTASGGSSTRSETVAKPVVAPPKRTAALEAKLDGIVLEEVAFDRLPLPDVLKYLRDESARLDPEKSGINFVLASTPVNSRNAIDPGTGLPVKSNVTPAVDMNSINVTLSLPLRHVSLRDVLDAVARVADTPIEIEIENYGVVVSPRASTSAAQYAMAQARYQARLQQVIPRGSTPTQPPKPHLPPPVLTPQPFNLDFGPPRTGSTEQSGAAAAGQSGDFWNTVQVPSSDDHTESGLKCANGQTSPIGVRMVNLGGSWGCGHGLGNKSSVLDDYSYPENNKGGNSYVYLSNVPAGKYQLYIYGHGMDDAYYGDYTVKVGSRSYGRKATTHGNDAVTNTKWVEGSQYVKFPSVQVKEGETVEILIQPGGQVTDPSGRTFADAMIAGLQLVPVR